MWEEACENESSDDDDESGDEKDQTEKDEEEKENKTEKEQGRTIVIHVKVDVTFQLKERDLCFLKFSHIPQYVY